MDTNQRRELLTIARQALIAKLRDQHDPIAQPHGPYAPIGGAFVTIKRDGILRGCMGTFDPKDSVPATIEYVARLAARDPRFESQPLTISELDTATVEISILSQTTKVDRIDQLIPGIHGIIVRLGDKTGCFLPKVATEMNWPAQEFVEQCCVSKAKLPANAWKKPGFVTYSFTAEVFSDETDDHAT
jgi:uncharacterized protein